MIKEPLLNSNLFVKKMYIQGLVRWLSESESLLCKHEQLSLNCQAPGPSRAEMSLPVTPRQIPGACLSAMPSLGTPASSAFMVVSTCSASLPLCFHCLQDCCGNPSSSEEEVPTLLQPPHQAPDWQLLVAATLGAVYRFTQCCGPKKEFIDPA